MCFDKTFISYNFYNSFQAQSEHLSYLIMINITNLNLHEPVASRRNSSQGTQPSILPGLIFFFEEITFLKKKFYPKR